MASKKKKDKQKKDILHPTWKIDASPTPNERLDVCDNCLRSKWSTHNDRITRICYKCKGRMREGTKEEYLEAKSKL